MITRTRTAILVAGAAASLMTLSACSGGGYGSGAAPASQLQSANQEVSQAGGVKLAVSQVGSLGQVVTDQNGLTLYRFDKDKAKPSASNCNAACAEMWPPALGDSANLQLQGVDAALVGAVTRADGTKQLTLSGWPLYTYAKDTTAGEAKGQGVGKTWFAVTPQGKKAQAQAVPGSAPGAVSGSAPGAVPGSAPSAVPGSAPGAVSGSTPGAVSGSTPSNGYGSGGY